MQYTLYCIFTGPKNFIYKSVQCCKLAIFLLTIVDELKFNNNINYDDLHLVSMWLLNAILWLKCCWQFYLNRKVFLYHTMFIRYRGVARGVLEVLEHPHPA